MKIRKEFIVAAVCVIALVAAVVAGFVLNGNNQSRTGQTLQTQIDELYEGNEYVKEAVVTTYDSSLTGEALESNAEAKSASVTFSVNKLNADVYDSVVDKLPDFGDFPVIYQISYTENDSNGYVFGFTKENFKDESISEAVKTSLEVYSSDPTDYMQLSLQQDEAHPDVRLAATVSYPTEDVAKAADYALKYSNERTLVNLISLPVSGDVNQEQSFVTTSVYSGETDTFEKRLQFGLNFADAAFNEDNRIIITSTNDEDVQVKYSQLSTGQTYDSLVKTAQDINVAGQFGLQITVIAPE